MMSWMSKLSNSLLREHLILIFDNWARAERIGERKELIEQLKKLVKELEDRSFGGS